MHPDRLADILSLLRWSVRDCADVSGWNERTVRRWLSGAYPIPAPVGEWLEALAEFHAANPPPRKG
jgi:hypothetical protein